MRLQPGTNLGPYEIVGPLGSGGMGEVYRARDLKLGREVALKILPLEFARDRDRVLRFEHEARTLASLNQHNIAQIYGFEQSGEIYALAMELVEGETLAQRLSRGPLAVTEAVAVARKIIAALDAAHERGVVHRDLKPANVMLTTAGDVKVLDFGLAKSPVTAPGDPARSPTALLTQTGTIIGTPAYMSPEQARGVAIDKRTDIWAFGCVLFEMLTAKQAFGGETVTDVLVAVMQNEPEWQALPPETPSEIRELLHACLQRDPRRRMRDVGDARLEPVSRLAAAQPERAWLGNVASLAVGSLLTAALFVFALRVMPGADATSPGVELQRITDAIGIEDSPALSPDGKSVAFVAPVQGQRQIWVRLLAGGASLQLTHDAGDHQQPRWTPDSAALVYFTPSSGHTGTLWQVSALGGSPRRLTSASTGGDVSHDGRQLAVFDIQQNRSVLQVIPLEGGAPRTVGELPAEAAYLYPRWSPDDKWIAFERGDAPVFDKRIMLVPAGGGQAREVARADDIKGLAWLAPDEIVYSSSRESTVLYPPIFNLRSVRTDGTNDRPLTFGDVSYIEPDADRRGTISVSRVRSQSNIWRFPVTGRPADNVRDARRITNQTGAVQVPSLSPDERELVYLSDSGGHGNLWIAATDSGETRQLTFERDPSVSIGVPVWQSSGDTITFIMTRAGSGSQWSINRDGSGLRRLVEGFWAYWSPDGRWLYYTVERGGKFAIEKIAAAGGAAVPVRSDDAAAPAVARDGTLFFCSPIRNSSLWEWRIQKAATDAGPASTLASLNGTRVPVEYLNVHPILSPDEKWLVQPLIDGATSNLWLINPADGAMHPITDFGGRPTVIARRVAWSPDSQSIYAAVADIDADVVVLKNLVRH